MYRIEVFNRIEDKHIEDLDFESESEETAIDQLEELAVIISGDSEKDERAYKYELQLWRQSGGREQPDELIETAYSNEYTDHRQYYCVWTTPIYQEKPKDDEPIAEIKFIDFFSENKGYYLKTIEAVHNLKVLDYLRVDESHGILRIS